MISILIVDDDAIVRSALTAYVAGADDIVIAGECSTGRSAIEFVRDQPVDVVLMDIHMPVMDGLTALPRLRAARPGTRVLLLTSFAEDDAMVTALRAGASGLLLKDASPTAVLDAIRSVHGGTSVFSPEPLGRLVPRPGTPGSPTTSRVTGASGVAGEAAGPPDRQGARFPALGPPQTLPAEPRPRVELSRRERDILQLLCQALSNAEIAQQLFLSESTVKTHVSALMTKLQVSSRLKVVVRAYEWGLVERDR